MTYTLGMDLGTTASAVALNVDGAVSMFSSGHQDLVIPSVVYMGTDGTVLLGEAAERRVTSDPAGIAREFKRRFGDPQPLILNGSPVAANDLMARLAQHLVDEVTEQRGEAPSEIVVCHPANWGDYKLALLSDTLNNSSLPPHRLISEPEAAAIHDAGQEAIEPGTVIAVYDLGGGTFDIALLRKLDDGWEILGKPGGIERLGGIDFDTAVLHHVIGALKLDLTSFELDDNTAQTAMFRLRDECTAAKHALSEDTSTSIPVLLPGVNETVRMTRSEFEGLIGPAVSRTLEVLDATIAMSSIEMSDIDRVLLVGGSSQVPLVRQRVMNHTHRPVAVDRHPKHAIALGAAASVNSSSSVFQPSSVETPVEAEPASEPKSSAPSTPAVSDPVKEMYELPHISDEPLPDFMQRGDNIAQNPAARSASAPAPAPAPATPPMPSATPPTPAAPTPAAPTPVAPSPTPPTPAAPSPAASSPPPRLVAPPVQQTVIERRRATPQTSQAHAHPPTGYPPADESSTTREEVRSGGGVFFWLAVLLIAAIAGGASYYFLRDRSDEVATADQTDSGATTTSATTTPESADSSVTTEAGDAVTTVTFETSCSPDQLPDPNVRYRVSEPSDGFLNGRNVPGLGTVDGVESTPVVTFLTFAELDVTYTDCEVDSRGRAWWGINSPSGMVWSSTLLIEPVP